MNRLLLFLLVILSHCSVIMSQVMTPRDMNFYDSDGRAQMVVDPAGYLTESVKNRIEKELEDLRLRYSVEVVFVIPPEIGNEEPAEWCEQLFSLWKIGKKDKDNGLLVMISPGSRAAFIMPGYGLEGIFTDAVCSQLYRNIIVPDLKNNDIDGAVIALSDRISSIIADPINAEELKSAQSENLKGGINTLDPGILWTFVQYVAVFLFLVAFCIFVYYGRKARGFKTHYEKAEFWRSKLGTFAVIGLCSLGTGFVFFILAYILYRVWRMRPLPCSTCGHKMKRLPEDKDNELLSDSQDFEEQIKTVDYDVWECPECGTIERFPFKSSQKKYTECPACHTIAMGLESDSVVRPSTVRTTGEGLKIYGCKFCHHKLRKPYVIPKKEDPSLAVAAAAAAMGSSRRGGGGGGFGGFGGFGGGSTGGGGAGGRW